MVMMMMMIMMMMMTLIIIIIIIIIIIMKSPRDEVFGNRSEYSGMPGSKYCPSYGLP